MRILSDYHHGSLYYSLHLLFQERLGWELYSPVGLDWFHAGYWRQAEPYGNNPGTVRQFLGEEHGEWRGDGFWYAYEPHNGFWRRGLTLEMFRQMPFDVVLSSHPSNDVPFARLVREVQPKARHVGQIGNPWQGTVAMNVLASAFPAYVPPGAQVVFYHQEFPLALFSPAAESQMQIVNFVHLHPERETFEAYRQAMPEFTFRSYGIGCQDGILSGLARIAETMRQSRFGWHLKPAGEGYGHILHNWLACGRPVIVKRSHLQHTVSRDLFVHGQNCIDLERVTQEEAMRLIRKMAEPEEHARLTFENAARFRAAVNFAEEAERIRRFLERLI